jgi:trimethylamine--corrinoid protein Co-methyltransferase
MKELSKQIGIGRPSFLSDGKKAALYEAALQILSQIGMRVLHDEGQAMMLAAGCTLDDNGRVHVPAEVVARAQATAPAHVTLYDRTGAAALDVGGDNVYFGTGSDLMYLFDLESGKRRLSSLADVATHGHLCDALPEIDFVMSGAWPNDVDQRYAYAEEFRAMVKATTKPLVMTAGGLDTVTVMWRLAGAVRGGEDELRARPYFVVYNQSSSPLEHPRESVDKLLFCADKGLPSIYCPAPLAGGTAPITTAGHIAQGLAEALFGLVLHQLRAPGAPIILGMGPAVLDMASAQSLYNAPEYLLGYAGIVEMIRWLGLPNWGYGGTTDSQVIDAQAGLEAGQLTMLSLLVGSNLNHDVGYLDFGLTGSFEQVVIMDEFIAETRRLLAGIEVNADTLALDVIAAAGPGGDFLSQRHTAKHLRSGQWRPTIINRLSYERWLADGGQDLREKARRRVLELLASHETPPLAADTVGQLDDIFNAYEPQE